MKRPRPDLRPSWRDPNMPVMRDYIMADGTTRNLVDPDYERRYREHLLNTTSHPDFRSDPTYNLSQRKPK